MESEPQVVGQTINPHFSEEAVLDAFRKELDTKPRRVIIPGFLFRNWQDHDFEFSPEEFKRIDLNLLARHTETYKRGLEARAQLLDRIKPVEILEMVHDIWGKGEIKQTEAEAMITYLISKPEEEWLTVYHKGGVHHGSAISGDSTYPPSTSYIKTGKWRVGLLIAEQRVGVSFGNARFPHYASTYTRELDKFFADPKHGEDYKENPNFPCSDYSQKNYSGRILKPSAETFIPDTQYFFRGIPENIWRRPDNLGVWVSVPCRARSVLSLGDGAVWFDQSVSQQEIMDYLSQQLESQRRLGQLPSQIEALELAKIEELRKRGLFTER